jgi:hypothetical protein
MTQPEVQIVLEPVHLSVMLVVSGQIAQRTALERASVRRPSGKPATTFRRQGDRMRRRELVLLLGSAMATARILRAQQKAMAVIGFLGSTSPGANAAKIAAFCQGLRKIGYVEGQNLAIEYRWAESHYDRLAALGRGSRWPQGRCDHCDGRHSRGAGGEIRNLNDPDRLSHLIRSRPASSPVSRV